MAGKLLVSCIRSSQKMPVARMSGFTAKIGKREVVGYGMNSEASYIDHHCWPMPAVRFREITPDLQVLKEKEKGDWKKLTIDEKKTLYRASFCQTFAEMEAPTGEWKSVFGSTLLIATTGLWIYILIRKYVYEPLPESFSEESQLAQLDRMRKLNMNPISEFRRQQKNQ